MIILQANACKNLYERMGILGQDLQLQLYLIIHLNKKRIYFHWNNWH